MNKEIFIEELKKLGIIPTEDQLNKLEKLYNIMIDYNKNVNLTRITEKEEVYLKHYYDSLTLIKGIDLNNINTMCDIGTGAGFPGLIIKIFYPNIKIILVDSLNKRIIYLNKVIKELELNDIKAIHIRAEDLSKKEDDKFELVVSRAVARIDKLIKFCMPIVKKNGTFIAMKAIFIEEEKLIDKKYNNYKIIKFNLPIENSERTLVIFNK
ncbi:MAG: 16S rRNA (guanine(527)-N(7))-methyltransferase RsmG [Bacilli bacterium]